MKFANFYHKLIYDLSQILVLLTLMLWITSDSITSKLTPIIEDSITGVGCGNVIDKAGIVGKANTGT